MASKETENGLENNLTIISNISHKSLSTKLLAPRIYEYYHYNFLPRCRRRLSELQNSSDVTCYKSADIYDNLQICTLSSNDVAKSLTDEMALMEGSSLAMGT